MGKSFVFGKTKVAKTSEEIRENISTTSKPEDENKQDETTSVTESSDTQQEDSKPSAPLESKEQKTEATNKPVTMTQKRKSKNTASRFALNGMKTENGIVVNVPMDDYMQLMMLKIQTGRTLKDLALQAIHEFVEKNKM